MVMTKRVANGRLGVAAAILSAFTLVISAPGCSDLMKRPADTAATRTLVENETPCLTPAERDRQFRDAYAAGVDLARQGRYGLALGAFSEAVSLNPDSIEALFNLGACHECAGDPVRAIQTYRQILEWLPDDPDCYANLGTSYIKLYHRERSPAWRNMAMDAWKHSLRLNPDQPQIRQYLASIGAGDD